MVIELLTAGGCALLLAVFHHCCKRGNSSCTTGTQLRSYRDFHLQGEPQSDATCLTVAVQLAFATAHSAHPSGIPVLQVGVVSRPCAGQVVLRHIVPRPSALVWRMPGSHPEETGSAARAAGTRRPVP